MSRRGALLRCLSSLSSSPRTEGVQDVVRGRCVRFHVAQSTESEGTREKCSDHFQSPLVRGISSSAIIFRFMEKWEDVEGTIDRLERRGLLEGRHLTAAFRIMSRLPKGSNHGFLQRLSLVVRSKAQALMPNEIGEMLHALGVMEFYDAVTLLALTSTICTRSVLKDMTRHSLVQAIDGLGRLRRRNHGFVLGDDLKEAIVSEVLRPSRLKKFSESQLGILIFAFDQFHPVLEKDTDILVHEIVCPLRTDALEPFLVARLISIPSVHNSGSRVVERLLSSVLEPARLESWSELSLLSLVDAIAVYRPTDHGTASVLVNEILSEKRLSSYTTEDLEYLDKREQSSMHAQSHCQVLLCIQESVPAAIPMNQPAWHCTRASCTLSDTLPSSHCQRIATDNLLLDTISAAAKSSSTQNMKQTSSTCEGSCFK